MAKVMVMRSHGGDHETSPVAYREQLWLVQAWQLWLCPCGERRLAQNKNSPAKLCFFVANRSLSLEIWLRLVFCGGLGRQGAHADAVLLDGSSKVRISTYKALEKLFGKQ
jgi:hypothetical protein